MAVLPDEADRRIFFEPAGELDQAFVVEVQELDADAASIRRILGPGIKN